MEGGRSGEREREREETGDREKERVEGERNPRRKPQPIVARLLAWPSWELQLR